MRPGKFRREERGQTLVIVALTIVALLGFTGLVTDIAWYEVNLMRIQRAADAAALAGVVFLPNNVVGAQTAGGLGRLADERRAIAVADKLNISYVRCAQPALGLQCIRELGSFRIGRIECKHRHGREGFAPSKEEDVHIVAKSTTYFNGHVFLPLHAFPVV